jgi:hypothetical protein
MKELRYQILTLLRDYTMLGMEVPFATIAARFPTLSYKNVSMQLSDLKSKGYVETKGNVGRYLYYISPKGIECLNWKTAKKQRAQAVLEADIELELARTNSFM